MKVLIIIPAYNESESIEKVIDNLTAQYPQYDYIIVNDGSKDNTAEICKRRGYHVINLPVNVGLAGGFQAGMKYAYKHGYDAAVQIDGDGQHDPRYIADLMKEMEQSGAGIVIGSRFAENKKPFTARMLGSRVISWAIRVTTGQHIGDPTSGMRLFGKTVLKEFATTMNYGPEPDTVCYLMRNGVKVSEVQVEMYERETGESYLNLTRSIWYMLCMCVSIFFVQWFRNKRED